MFSVLGGGYLEIWASFLLIGVLPDPLPRELKIK